MSVIVINSRALTGVVAPAVAVEVHVTGGLPGIHIVGLPDAEVREARDRVRSAIQNAQFDFPARKVIVNLAPADLPKESGRYDLPIALGILAATSQVPAHGLGQYEFAGELALSGALRPVRGALAMALAASRACRAFVLPEASAAEASLVQGAAVFGATSLLAVCEHLAGRTMISPTCSTVPLVRDDAPDLADVRGQRQAKRALEIAAAGGHSLLFIGPPGTGKSMLAQRLPGLLPPLGDNEALEVAAVASIAGRFLPETLGQRPYRAPHHTASAVALVGGGSDPRPGEISLAHHGVLFLDELPEWDRRVLEVLREPLESGVIHISRAARQSVFPAQFQLIAAMNPCPCGWLGDPRGRCHCTPDRVGRYRARISGPLLDRIDIALEVPAVPADQLAAQTATVAADGAREPSSMDAAAMMGESSLVVRGRVIAARNRQLLRQGKANARLTPKEVIVQCAIDAAGSTLLAQAAARMALSARAYHRVLKVARTIADLADVPHIESRHIAEAVGYRGAAGR
ncbi:MAG: YifB family Mg chelatase-like AAA ATPase [Betaproteobacteria bacterium]